jgi:tetratricopeptide (TPR) repeat protein
MMKKTIYLLLLLTAMASCHKKSMTERMNEIDSLVIQEQYDSAYASVIRIDRSEITEREDAAQYHLLLVQTSILTHHPNMMTMLDSLVIPYYIKNGNHEKLAEAYYYKAYGKVMQRVFPEATLWYKKAEEQAHHSSNYRLHYKIAESLAVINEIMGNHTLQLDYAQKTLEIAKTAQNEEWMAYAYYRISNAHSWLCNDDSAVAYINKTIPLFKYIKEKDLPSFMTNAAYTLKQTSPSVAKSLLNKSLSLKEHSITLEHLADISYDEGNQEEAYRLWKKALTVNDGIPKDNALHNILDYDVEHGRTEHICETVNEIIHIKDSMLNSLRNDTIKDLQLRFDHEVAMRRQEQVTSNWQKGVLAAVILVVVLAAYIFIRRILEKNKMQEVQMQINDYMNQIHDLEVSGKESDEEIARLNKQIKDYMSNKAPDLLRGSLYYEQIKEDKIKTLSDAGWRKKEEQQFIDYYTAIDYRTVNRLRKAKRKEKLTTHNLFFLLLLEMGKTEEYIANLFGISLRSIDTIKTRTKVIE